MAETFYHLVCATRWRRRFASTVVGLLLAAACTSTWWGFHIPGPRHMPIWVYAAILSLITGGGGAFVTRLLLWLWYKEHEVLCRCQAYRAQQLSVVLEMSNTVRNALQVICHAGWMPRDAELFLMVQDSVRRIESELRRLVSECDHASHEPPGHLGPDGWEGGLEEGSARPETSGEHFAALNENLAEPKVLPDPLRPSGRPVNLPRSRGGARRTIQFGA